MSLICNQQFAFELQALDLYLITNIFSNKKFNIIYMKKQTAKQTNKTEQAAQ